MANPRSTGKRRSRICRSQLRGSIKAFRKRLTAFLIAATPAFPEKLILTPLQAAILFGDLKLTVLKEKKEPNNVTRKCNNPQAKR